MRWTLIVEPEGRTGAVNMAVDTRLLELAGAGRAFLRFYGWDPPCLSFGRNEPAARRYDRARIRGLGLDVVRRPTGGRAVWHEREITYAVAAPQSAFGSLRDAYVAIHRVLVEALRSLHIDAALAPPPRTASHGAGACFASPIGGEVTVANRKLIGSAQYRQHDALLQHGSILLEDRQDIVTELLIGGGPAPDSIALAEVAGSRSGREVVEAVALHARRSWGGEWRDGPPLDPGAALDTYRDPAWTWRR